MKSTQSKNPQKILIRIIHRDIQDGLLSEIKTVAEVSLQIKLYDYVVRLGYSSAHILGFIVELFTKGKVRVDFPNYTERLELVNSSDKLTGMEAMKLFNDFIQEIGSSTGTAQNLSHNSKTTQMIVIHTEQQKKRTRKIHE